jgi:hypothetical protein
MLFVSIMALSSNAIAGDIDKTKARQVGAYFMASQFGDKAITAQSLDQVYEIKNTVRDIAALYVFNTADKRGFVIVSGSDCADPIVAYSTEGAFDPNNIPPNMLWWLNEQAGPIAYAQNNHIEATRQNVDAWEVLEQERLPYFGQNAKAITRLTTSKWNQSPIYNNLCPSDNGGKCVTGCVATAMAQIIYYWRFPRQPKGYKAYAWGGTALEVNFAEQYYNYDIMVDELTNNSTPEQINEVAKLSYHCGVAVEMNYGSESSGAQSEKVQTAINKYFKYEKDSLNFIKRTDARYYNENNRQTPNAKDTLWVNDIKEQILLNRPVYYAGYAPGEGVHARHAFVCDGWNSVARTMHFNWGWGGSGDCWCNVYRSNLNAPGYLFTDEHKALLGITPPMDSVSNYPVAIHPVENPFICSVYPNPASEQITVGYSIDGNRAVDMQIFDATGREVRRVAVVPSANYVNVDIADLTPGIYICRLQGHSQKFIVK